MDKQSGHNFHFEIEDRVKAKGWEIHSKLSYLDDVENKPREIDFLAMQQRESYNPRGNQVAIVAECKYLNHDVNFWFRDNPKNHKAYFVDGYSTDKLFIDENRFHFFVPQKVAVALEEGGVKKDMYEAIIQTSKALMYFREDSQMLYTKGLFYSVVIYKGPGKLLDQDGNELTDILFYHEYAWRSHRDSKIVTRHLYVDVIHESNLEHYIEDIYKREMDILMSHVFIQNKINESVDRGRRVNPAR